MNVKNLSRRVLNKVAPTVAGDVYSHYFNTPVKFVDGNWFTNERIVEVAFALTQIGLGNPGQRVLEFGCTKSDLSLQLASYGYDVTGIDLRPYAFEHPNISFTQQNLLELNDTHGFDFITSISVIEHIGLGVYGETQDQSDLEAVANKLIELLKPKGKLIITVPFGQPHADHFLRSFGYDEIKSVFDNDSLSLITERFFARSDVRYWLPVSLENAMKVSNALADRGPTGVNCVGCFVWQKD